VIVERIGREDIILSAKAKYYIRSSR